MIKAYSVFRFLAWFATVVASASLARSNTGFVQTVQEGAQVTLSAEFDAGIGPFHFQWSKDGVTIPNEQGPTLRLPSIRMSDAGTYVVYVSNSGGTANSQPARLRVKPESPGRLSNFAVIASEDTLIMGFALSEGSDFQETPFLVRAAGPALEQFGISRFKSDPQLKIFRQNQLAAENDNWSGANVASAAASVQAFEFSAGSLDSAVLLPLRATGYTAVVNAPEGNSGSALIELFELSTELAHRRPRLVNLSARVAVASSDDTVIAGFTISGTSPVRILARGIGPSLSQFGVGDALNDPRLQLFRGSTLIGSNDDWRQGGALLIADAARTVGAFALPLNSLDSALMVLLHPGSYTLQLTNVTNRGGSALIELYEMP
jgi:hypothetical protein